MKHLQCSYSTPCSEAYLPSYNSASLSSKADGLYPVNLVRIFNRLPTPSTVWGRHSAFLNCVGMTQNQLRLLVARARHDALGVHFAHSKIAFA